VHQQQLAGIVKDGGAHAGSQMVWLAHDWLTNPV
jgi:hypothetical protein